MKITNGFQNGTTTTTTHSSFVVQQKPWTPTKRRGPISGEWKTPGPADITLPSTFGVQRKVDVTRSKSPAFTFAGKREEKTKFVTPGPGSYNVSGVRRTGKEAQQGKTISGRTKSPQPFKTPAPGEYSPQRRVVLNKSPAFSFGHKGKDPKPDNVPGRPALDLIFLVVNSNFKFIKTGLTFEDNTEWLAQRVIFETNRNFKTNKSEEEILMIYIEIT
ncbi:hypothetical protein AVEN_25005-1 [Araneus ventricosus]|uniref:Outer dense fiber protein 3 n=1 Tax=Araneus ventricosus TaxID=182803 RepID=A0A4Y2FFR9_ARAVE|nr:hypothetical protein AVEN_25005-1 [Araneus ventricosus]